MNGMRQPWDYLIVTASNDLQARAYESQLALRQRLGLLCDIGHAMVVADPGGKRVGSGGSTLYCLMAVLDREARLHDSRAPDFPRERLEKLRILIVHAGGDSKRLPAYGPCGKIFVPVPGENDTAVPAALFDRLLPNLSGLPSSPAGQLLVASGDALLDMDATSVRFDSKGLTALGCHATPEAASKHGVFCAGEHGEVRLYLQKPKLSEQAAQGAINRHGQSILDVGVMSFDAEASCGILKAFEVQPDASGAWKMSPAMEKRVLAKGVDLYREICCAMGTGATAEEHRKSAKSSGSSWPDADLEFLFHALRDIPFHIQVVPRCGFLHFGTTRQVITSGLELLQRDLGSIQPGGCLNVNNAVGAEGSISGPHSWVEGCAVDAPLTLAGDNVVVGIDISEPMALPKGACLEVVAGKSPQGKKGFFIRCYHIADTFKDAIAAGGTFCGMPMIQWIGLAGAKPEDIWDATIPFDKRSLWDARVFPLAAKAEAYREWLWMHQPSTATPAHKKAFLKAPRFSAAEIAHLADQDAFHRRRQEIRASEVRHSLRRLFRLRGPFSADDLSFSLQQTRDTAGLVKDLLTDAKWHWDGGGMETFIFSRMIHSLGAAVETEARGDRATLTEVLPHAETELNGKLAQWLKSIGLDIEKGKAPAKAWARKACETAFASLNDAILASSMSVVGHPKNALRRDETAWGRAPARLELGGGWTDTPPYTLEHGGSVINTAVNLNGQPPIHCYGRVIEEPVIRLGSIDTGCHVEVRKLADLLDYRKPSDPFALVKAALAISGFSPQMSEWPARTSLKEMLVEFGGGIELTTLAGIPKGSGLGTSSIIGTVIVAVLARMMGRNLTQRELFHQVLRLEQALTTGGGWQDQIGGGVGGTKLTVTQPGLFPDPHIHYVPNDVLDPKLNGGATLLYYTGITRLAKNILQQVVGGYLNRDRTIMSALSQEHDVAKLLAEALALKDAARFGGLIDEAWRLQKRLCGEVTNERIESLLHRVRPHIHGARILGAGSGGFLLMICKSPSHAASIRSMLEAEPLNDRARFFDFDINHQGLEVTTC
jgi:galactokinase/mevalonate kinase-like predicted kinase